MFADFVQIHTANVAYHVNRSAISFYLINHLTLDVGIHFNDSGSNSLTFRMQTEQELTEAATALSKGKHT